MSRRDPVRRPGKGPTRPRFAPAAAPRTLRAPWTEVAPNPGLLRAARGRGKPQTQLRWVSQTVSQARTEMAPDPGLLRATKEGGKPQTQLRSSWVSRVQGGLQSLRGILSAALYRVGKVLSISLVRPHLAPSASPRHS